MKLSSLALAISVLCCASAHAQVKNASIESVSYPNSMEAGKSYQVSVSVRNTGDVTWTTGTPESGLLYRLGAVGDSTVWGPNRANMPSASVPPGGTQTFTFSVTAPQNASGQINYVDFLWQMVHERTAWFGEKTPTVGPYKYQVSVAKKAPLDVWSTVTPSKPVVQATAQELSFSNFRAGNILYKRYGVNDNKHTDWFHSDTDTRIVLDAAKRMNLNVIRFPVVIPPSGAAYVPSEWGNDTPAVALNKVIAKTRFLMDEAQLRGMKVIVTFDGYTKYNDGNCYWKKTFRDIESNARTFVANIYTHPSLFAWDLLNEPLHNAAQRWGQPMSCLESSPGVANQQAYQSTVNAVHAMYNLVRELDVLNHYTTVGEGNLAYMDYWTDIASFHSFHWYFDVPLNENSTITANKPAVFRGMMKATIDQMRNVPFNSPRPIAITEFGYFRDRTLEDGTVVTVPLAEQTSWYKQYLFGLKLENVGGALWSLSTFNEYRVHGNSQLECVVKGIQTSDNPPC